MRHPAEKAPEIIVPHDPIVEQAIIAAALVSDEARLSLLKRLTPEHFLVDKHREIWAAFGELARRKLNYDPATVQRLIGSRVDIAYAAQLQELRPDAPDNLPWLINTILWDKQRATAVQGPISALLEAIKNPQEEPDRIRALARHVSSCFDGNGGSFLHNPKELVRTQMALVRKRTQGHAYYPYGIPGLDCYDGSDNRRMLPGAMPGQTTIITAVPGAGKSTLTGHIALGLARSRRRVLLAAWEVGAGLTLELLACLSLVWNRTEMMEGKINRENQIILEERMHSISKHVRFMKNPFRRQRGEKPSNDRNLDIVQGEISDSGCDVFIADLWKRCLVDARPEAEEQALFRQQSMAEEMCIHNILVHQQRSKDIEQRDDKRPTREGMKGSSALTEIADTILGVHRPALWKRIDDDKLEVFVLKQRFGKWPLGVEFDWNADEGSIKGGRSIDYEQPGETGHGGIEDGFVTPGQYSKKKSRRG